MKFVKFKCIAEPCNHFFVDSIHLSATRGRQSCFVMPPIGLCVFPRSRKVMQSRSLACRSESFTDWGVEVWELRLWNKYFSHCSCAVGIHFCFSGVSNFFFSTSSLWLNYLLILVLINESSTRMSPKLEIEKQQGAGESLESKGSDRNAFKIHSRLCDG